MKVAVLLAVALLLGACGGSPGIPPLPQQLRSLDQREAGCASCHSTGRAKPLDPTVNATPADHPPLAVMEILRDMRAHGDTQP